MLGFKLSFRVFRKKKDLEDCEGRVTTLEKQNCNKEIEESNEKWCSEISDKETEWTEKLARNFSATEKAWSFGNSQLIREKKENSNSS